MATQRTHPPHPSVAACIWNLNASLHPLQAVHTFDKRALCVQALSWSPSHPQHFATLSIHPTALLWDLRNIHSPVLTLPPPVRTHSPPPASSSYILYHPSISYLLATATGSSIHVFDVRSTSGPVQSFHSPLSSSLSALSWARHDPALLLSASQSQQIEFWSSPLHRAEQLTAGAGLQYRLQTEGGLRWAEFALFGRALLTLSQDECVVDLWNVGSRLGQGSEAADEHSTDVNHVARLTGHNAPITQVEWHCDPSTSSSSLSPGYQLFSLSQDRRLLVHSLPLALRSACGDDAAAAELGDQLGLGDERSAAFASCSAALRSELTFAARSLPSFRYHSFSPVTRQCEAEFSSASSLHALHLLITFPASYPALSPPLFTLLPSSSPVFLALSFDASHFLREASHVAVAAASSSNHVSLLPALSYLEQHVHELAPPDTPSPQPPSPAHPPLQRKQVRIQDSIRPLASVSMRAPIRKGLTSASTPALSSLGSARPEERLSSSLSSPGEVEEYEMEELSAEASDEEDDEEQDTPLMATMEEDDAEGLDAEALSVKNKEFANKKEQRDFELPCPRLCGASWGPRGQLVLFNNFPQLTHYLTLTRMRRKSRRPERRGEEEKLSNSAAIPESQRPQSVAIDRSSHHGRHVSFVAEHDEDEWSDIHQMELHDELITPGQLMSGGTGKDGAEQEGEQDAVVFPPRSFGHLLQLPFCASYLASIIGERSATEREGRAVMRGRRDNGADELNATATNSEAPLEDSHRAVQDDTDSEEENDEDDTLNSAPLSALDSLAHPASPTRNAGARSPTATISPSHARRSSDMISPAPPSSSTGSSPSVPPSAGDAASLLPSTAIPSTSTGRSLILSHAAGADPSTSTAPSLPVNTALLLTDLSSLFPCDPQLSAAYAFSTTAFPSSALPSASALCAHFQEAAKSVGRADLVQLWKMMLLVFRPALIGRSEEQEAGRGWGGAAWGGGFVRQLMADYWQRGDVETVALLACLLSLVPQSKVRTQLIQLAVQPALPAVRLTSPSPTSSTSRVSASASLRPAKALRSVSAHSSLNRSSPALLTPAMMLRSHSGSSDLQEPSPSSAVNHVPASSSLPNLPQGVLSPPSPATSSSPFLHPSSSSSSLTSPTFSGLAAPSSVSLSISVDDLYKLVYADYLHRLGLVHQRATVLQCLRSLSAQPESEELLDVVSGWSTKEMRVGFDPVCQRCGHAIAPAQSRPSQSPVRCARCNVYASHCVICMLSLRGLSSFCLLCGHGGHMRHMQEWFDSGEKECPTGCGCQCSEEQQLYLP